MHAFSKDIAAFLYVMLLNFGTSFGNGDNSVLQNFEYDVVKRGLRGKKSTRSCLWRQLGQDLFGENANEMFGYSIARNKNGKIIAVGAPGYNSEKGYVAVFKLSKSKWVRRGQKLYGRQPSGFFGGDVALSDNGNILAVGSQETDTTIDDNTGLVKVFQYNTTAGSWTQMGQALKGWDRGGEFGCAVDLSGDGKILVVGAEDHGAPDEGEFDGDHGIVRIFRYVSKRKRWVQICDEIVGRLDGDDLGYSVSISKDGQIVAMGAKDAGSEEMGAVEVLKYNVTNDSWDKLGNPIYGEASGDEAGHSVCLNAAGDIVAIGAPYNIGQSIAYDSGQVRVFKWDGGSWKQMGNDIYGERVEDFAGSSVYLDDSGKVLAVGSEDAEGRKGGFRLFHYRRGNWVHIGPSMYGIEGGDYTAHKDGLTLSSNGRVVTMASAFNNEYGSDTGFVRTYYLVMNCSKLSKRECKQSMCCIWREDKCLNAFG